MFPKQKEEQAEFKEPSQLNGKQRWQIIQLLFKNDEKGTRPQLRVKSKSETKSKVEWQIASEGLGDKHAMSASDDNDTFTEVHYKKGVYLHPDATLKDLRNTFIDSYQLDAEDEEIAMTHAKSYDILVPEGSKFHHIHYYTKA